MFLRVLQRIECRRLVSSTGFVLRDGQPGPRLNLWIMDVFAGQRPQNDQSFFPLQIT